MRGGKFLE